MPSTEHTASGRLAQGWGAQRPSPLQEVLILAPVGEACPAHTQVLHQSQVLDLVADEEVVKLAFGEIEERVTGKAPSAPPKPSFQAAAPGWVQPQRLAIRPQLCFFGDGF